MEEKIIKIAKNLIEVRKLKEELNNKEYWIKKAAKETDFIPAEDDWIYIEITLFTIRVSVHHNIHGASKHWINGQWFNHLVGANYPIYEKMIEEMQT